MALDPSHIPLVIAFVALFVGLLGAGVSVAAILQKQRSDKRDALWKRSQLAIEMSQSDKPAERELGTNMIKMLLDQDQLSDDDADLLQLASQAAVVGGEWLGAGDDEMAAIDAVQREGFDDAQHSPDTTAPRMTALDSDADKTETGAPEGGSDV